MDRHEGRRNAPCPLGSDGAAALKATTDDKFQLLNGRVTFEPDAAKRQMVPKPGAILMIITNEKSPSSPFRHS